MAKKIKTSKARRACFVIGAIMFFASCAGNTAPGAEKIARDTIKAVMRPVIANQFPGVPTDVVVDCTIDNASPQEIVQIANSALLGTATDSLYVILPIIRRPATIACVAQNTAGLLLKG